MTPDAKFILGPMRVPFLILTPACVLLGTGTAFWRTGQFNLLTFVLVLIGAVCAHISVNALNEYFDFRSGLDARTSRTPFSGGSGTLQSRPGSGRSALVTGLVTLAITAAVGLYVWAMRGPAILPLGLLGLFVIVTYTFLLLKNPITSLIAPGLGFGTFMVMGADFAQIGQYSWTAFIASLVPFFLVSDLLLLNQFPDVEADRTVDRRHYPILIGRKASAWIYIAFLAGAYLAIVVGVLLGQLPVWALLGLLTLVIAVPAGRTAYRSANAIPTLVPAMGQNVLVNLITPALVAVGLIIAGI